MKHNKTMYLVMENADSKANLDYLTKHNLAFVSGIKPTDITKYLYKPYQYDYTIITPSLDIFVSGILHDLWSTNTIHVILTH